MSWALFTLGAGFSWCLVMLGHRRVILRLGPDEKSRTFLGGIVACLTLVFVCIFLMFAIYANSGEGDAGLPDRLYWGVLTGLVLGVVSAFGIFGKGEPPNKPPAGDKPS